MTQARTHMLADHRGATRLIFIVGDTIVQVKSPAGVTAMLRACGADLMVVPAHVAPVDRPASVAAITRMRNADGIVVAVPHKFAALQS